MSRFAVQPEKKPAHGAELPKTARRSNSAEARRNSRQPVLPVEYNSEDYEERQWYPADNISTRIRKRYEGETPREYIQALIEEDRRTAKLETPTQNRERMEFNDKVDTLISITPPMIAALLTPFIFSGPMSLIVGAGLIGYMGGKLFRVNKQVGLAYGAAALAVVALAASGLGLPVMGWTFATTVFGSGLVGWLWGKKSKPRLGRAFMTRPVNRVLSEDDPYYRNVMES